MALSKGSRIGSYEIVSAIGAGGMGEVYRARDTKLGRDVAIKVLPDGFAGDAERMARFEREAKVLASLNHPNIATIHGLEDSGDSHALVMELVEGPTLADRIKQGPIPIQEALPIAKQIAEALEYAHERGIIHRDLKPANIKVTADDTVKILDFGLAKAIEGDSAPFDISTSPTLSRMATQAGVLLGTAGYMSPEQAKAKPTDRRADIWAFGCVLYEMLVGKAAFQGEAVTDTLASVIKEEPDWSQLPAAMPMRVRVLLQRCLQKDLRQRLQAIGEARISLDEVLSSAPDPLFVIPERPDAPSGLMRLEISLPLASITTLALSPDGKHLAISGQGAASSFRLWVRSLDSLDVRPLYGSEAPTHTPFFWSPESRFMAFGAFGKLKKIDVAGGPAQVLCDTTGIVVGGAWNQGGTIIFGQAPGGLSRVSANGGPALAVTTLNPSRRETWHTQPSFLPDGRHFVYLRGSTVPDYEGLYVGSLDAKPEDQDSTRLLPTHLGATYVPPSGSGTGHLLFVRDGTLMAQPFDAGRLELSGEPISLAKQIGSTLTTAYFSVSTNGVLIYRTGNQASQLTWFDRRGKRLGTVGDSGTFVSVSLSPDGSRAAVGRADARAANLGLWLIDLVRGTSTRFTFGASIAPVGIWSPDGSRLIFGSGQTAKYDLYNKLTSGVKDEELLLASEESKFPRSCSRDGRFLLYSSADPTTKKSELWVLPLEGDKKPIPFVRSQFNNGEGQFSPDGHFVAYVSDESGREEIYVRTFSPDFANAASDDDGRWLISTEGGIEPRWSGDGQTLYYLAPNGKVMAVDIRVDAGFRAGVPKALFQAPVIVVATSMRHSWDVTPDGKRFLFATRTEQGAGSFNVVLNWQALLKK